MAAVYFRSLDSAEVIDNLVPKLLLGNAIPEAPLRQDSSGDHADSAQAAMSC